MAELEVEEAKVDEKPDPFTGPRSVSQLKEYSECAYRFYLHRVAKKPQRPAAWLPQGLAVHEAAEMYEVHHREPNIGYLQDVYTASYDAHTNRLLADTQRTKDWFRSGPYDGATDIERRYKLGLEHVERYVNYYKKNPKEVPLKFDNGEPAVEYPFNVAFGDVAVRGVIDYIGHDYKPRDNKSGNRPGDIVQLGVYAGVVEKEFGAKPTTGDFLMTKTGKVTYPLDLRDYTEQYLTDTFGELDENVKAKRFDPNPSEGTCTFCPVARHCEFSMAKY